MNGQELEVPGKNKGSELVVFSLGEQRYALHLSAVDRVVRVVEITPLPNAPEIVLGVVNVQGRVIPVVDIRKRFRLPQREVDLSDRFIIAQTSRRMVAIVADSVRGLAQRAEQEVIAAERILPGMDYVEGVAKFEDGMVLIHDLGKFLSLDEEQALDESLKKARKHGDDIYHFSSAAFPSQ
jgi:purine-binding chemotaxis protein CheW